MISRAVMGQPYANRRIDVNKITNSVVADRYESVHLGRVLDTDELLGRLDAMGVKNVQIARALGLPDSRVPEIKAKKRALKHDEAVKLVRAFQLEEGREVPPIPLSIMRLVVRHVADRLHARASEALIEDVAQDLKAFGVFLADRRVRQSIEAAEGFFQALRYRRSGSEEEARQETDPHLAR